ncbi:hypothetical protein [Streptomyces synnematoformans]|uniref:Uncharacterized protein n=1 Tax=Streptomyces synnematoformans TaxID=415721 RepID=A0ABP4KKH1_9ACTN
MKRRLPFPEDGRRAYISGPPDGLLHRAADEMEAEAIRNARAVHELSGSAAELIQSGEEAAFLVDRLRECLMDMIHVAEARGERP